MWRYRLLLTLLALPLLAYTAWVAVRGREARYLRERMGLGRVAPASGALWLHAASVGEVNAAAALIGRLQSQVPGRTLVITTVTPTGGAAARRLGTESRQQYLPIDWAWAVRRFLRRLQPACLLVMETELWPNLYRECARARVPVVIINGRLSARTLRARPWLRRLYRQALLRVRAVLARSTADAEAFIALGAAAPTVRVIGNLKFAGGGAPVPADLGRPYVLAASTREGEERLIVDQWRATQHGGRLLVIAPRHPQRLGAIVRELAGARIAVRSRGEPVLPDTEVYLADTLGELPALIGGAELVVMGGSFAPFGGHNILEPARLGKAVVFGPHMEHFADEADTLLAHQGGLRLASVGELAGCLTRLLSDARERARLGENGARLMASRAQVLEDYLAALAELCPASGAA